MILDEAQRLLDKLAGAYPGTILRDSTIKLYLDKLSTLGDASLAREVIDRAINVSPKFPSWSMIRELYQSAEVTKRAESDAFEGRRELRAARRDPGDPESTAEIMAKLAVAEYEKHGIGSLLGKCFEAIAERLQRKANEGRGD